MKRLVHRESVGTWMPGVCRSGLGGSAPHQPPLRTDLSAQELCQGLHEPLWIVEPWKVSAARLHGQLGLTEHAGIIGGTFRRERDVVLARDEKDPPPKAGKGGSGGGWVEGAGRGVDGCPVPALLTRLLGAVTLVYCGPS